MTTEFLASLGVDLDSLNEGDAPASTPLQPGPYAEPEFSEPCKACRGSGVFRSYSGRAVGQCFKCKGKGQLKFKTSPEARAKAREGAAARKQRKLDEWAAANPTQWAWIVNTAPRFAFAQAMLTALTQYGTLTDGQMTAVNKLVAKDAERAAQRQTESAARQAAAPEVSVAAIETAFATARENGIRYPKLRLDTFVFSPAGANSKNPGAIYVKEGERYLGKVADGKFLRVRETDDATEARIIAAAADPANAAKAYGMRFGACSVCGRELTNKVSIDAGIGPVCASRFGFG